MKNKKEAINLFDFTGSFAEDKDVARLLRHKYILRLLEKNKRICLNFSSVELTTQSFIHALISESIRKYGEPGLDLIEFKKCQSQIKSIIKTVVGYSLEFSYNDPKLNKVNITTDEIPQASNLGTIRIVLEALRGSSSIDEICNRTKYSKRHVGYRLSAARSLNFLEPLTGELTESGQKLLNTKYGSEDERKIYINAIEDSKVFQMVAPDLFEDPSPSIYTLTKRILMHTNLSETTAHRRASTLLAWKRQVGESQLILELFGLK